ncbi:MAG: pilus assembly PilX N-terminal domain-containing protein [Candidatus Pacebacteria bacterium]|nr:pilus assembly PilX N-terminal domain-containing protein [Candidatus Paceibacterota bacterium]
MLKNFVKIGNQGVTLYLTIVILSVFTAVVLTLTAVSVSQIKITWLAGDSAKAFFAADTGVEQALFNIRKQDNFGDIAKVPLGYGSSYIVNISTTTDTTSIQSKGEFRSARRTIEARY